MDKRLADKSAVITGANRGIGRAIVEKFAENGCSIWACARKQLDSFEEDMRELSQRYQVEIMPVYFDLQSQEEIRAGVRQIQSVKKPIDVLVNNAGIAHGALFQMTSTEKLKEIFEVNFFSQITLMQLISRSMMRARSGSIVNMVSVGGIETNPGYLAYGSSKAALIWSTKTIARELGVYGIRVNGVAPGLVKTEMGQYKTEEELQKVVERTTMKRMADPEEIAEAVLYLAGDASSFVTGHILTVDGGRLI